MTEPLSPAAHSAIDLIESILSDEGMSPHAGRILGYLMMKQEAVPFSDLARELCISRGSASQNTTLLERHGVIERVKLPSDRRDHFKVRENARDMLLERARQRRDRTIQRIEDLTRAPGFSNAQIKSLTDMRDFIQSTQKAASALEAEIARTKDRQA